MKAKKDRHQVIREIILTGSVGNQDDLLKALENRGIFSTQATLSRDLKAMRIIKIADEMGDYRYKLPAEHTAVATGLSLPKDSEYLFRQKGFLSIEFSGNMAVIKTRAGYAAGIALDIDQQQNIEFLGSIAGDDTILLIIREGVAREKVLNILMNEE